MHSLISSISAPQLLPLLRDCFVLEWGNIDPFEGNEPSLIIPAPVLAVEGKKLLGGLAFTTAKIPDSQEIGVWINAVYVIPEYRGERIGSQLVQKAETEAAAININQLYVHTDIPNLYQKLHWSTVNCSGDSFVLTKTIS